MRILESKKTVYNITFNRLTTIAELTAMLNDEIPYLYNILKFDTSEKGKMEAKIQIDSEVPVNIIKMFANRRGLKVMDVSLVKESTENEDKTIQEGRMSMRIDLFKGYDSFFEEMSGNSGENIAWEFANMLKLYLRENPLQKEIRDSFLKNLPSKIDKIN